MKRLIAPVLLLMAACNPQQSGEPVTRIDFDDPSQSVSAAPSAAPAVSTASICKPVAFDGARFTDCVADPARHTIETVLGNPPYRSFRALSDALGEKATTVAFAVNAGMFDGEGKPIGYYVRGGERGHELSRADGPGNFHMKPNGVFFGTGTKWQVMASDAFYSGIGDRPQFGTQSGPMLVVEGKLHPQITDDGPSQTIRNGVGIDPQGRAHFVISEGPVSFGKLARYFRDQVKARNALYLDGSVSALWDPASKRMDARAPIGPMIVVMETAQ